MGSRQPAAGAVVGTVVGLSRFPIKSTSGERLDAVRLDGRGISRDREWAIYTGDGGIASGKTTRRFRRVDGLMAWRSWLPDEDGSGDAVPRLVAPDGSTYRADDPAAVQALTTAFGRRLTPRRETTVRHHDESGVHLVTTSSIRAAAELVGAAVDVRRLRANLVLDTRGTGFREDAWVGAWLAVGSDVVLRCGPGMPRCVMVDRPQFDVAAGPYLLRPLGRARDALLGAQAEVVRPGTVEIGDVVRLAP